MDAIKARRVLGIRSNSSLEGMELSVLTTDGVDVFDYGPSQVFPYEDSLYQMLRRASGKEEKDFSQQFWSELEQQIMAFSIASAKELIEDYDEKIELIGFSGPIILQQPENHYIHQLGNPYLLCDTFQVDVVSNFRKADIMAGGKGSPLSASYYALLLSSHQKPIVVVNIDGISSIVWIGDNGEIAGFDAGVGCLAINNWVEKHGAQRTDYNGKLAITGTIHPSILFSLMRDKYLAKFPPKSADFSQFKDKLEHLEGLSLQDGCATVTAYVAESIIYSLSLYIPQPPKEVIVCGSGAGNPTLVRFLRQLMEETEIKTAKELGWNAETMEAQAIAYMAMRRIHQLPIGLPTVTGVSEPVICGEIFFKNNS